MKILKIHIERYAGYWGASITTDDKVFGCRGYTYDSCRIRVNKLVEKIADGSINGDKIVPFGPDDVVPYGSIDKIEEVESGGEPPIPPDCHFDYAARQAEYYEAEWRKKAEGYSASGATMCAGDAYNNADAWRKLGEGKR